MLIRIGYDIIFNIAAPTPMALLLYTHPSLANNLRQPEQLQVSPDTPTHEFLDNFGNRCVRLVAPPGPLRLYNDALIEDSGEPDAVYWDAVQHPVEDLPDETLPFLLASRYCEVDRLSDIAWNLFGQSEPGWPRVQAISDWVHQHVAYGYQHANPLKTAFDVYETGGGVCRDFQHLAVTLCRCMNIPARYVAGYLGDIRIEPTPTPMDFHAWFEAYLGGRWHTFDARHNTPRVGRVLMARGRDAVDVALTTSFGSAQLHQFIVRAEEIVEADASVRLEEAGAVARSEEIGLTR